MPATLSLSGALGHAHADKRIDILRHIGVCGSISQAARAVGVSYKAAWQALDTLTNLAGAPLVARAVGGAGGGGARLTAAGRELLAAADALALARGAVLARWQAAPDAGPALARLALRTSMRNQLPCTVGPLALQGQIVRVPLRLARTDGAGGADGALDLAARITRESAELLGLQPGLAVQALCKATAVRVERAGAALAAEPGILRLPAKAVRVVRGSSGDEVSAELAAGLQLVGFAMPGSGLRAGHRVVLVLEENAVVLALAHG
ncbi:TOBE domain-containing protein [Verminephrobacter eiseniae]|uniref:TOBE domain-containing protein n=1 Tax=Verminephrobacter eiseniae TaxID=364317 RepID=UPI002237822D|nr:TOBE domain-containing protein [Verminephrobacter eiseniae]MCW5230321.1 LysR family transcriptional regulator [Verminephrobacter eiseniae]MCW5292054.1 LysR family transcriptional regulator [Verminephrobacter eiseniae]MCW8185334.1 LysR family transcriptional regulator [Verminephrobacter eiseniae]MCW8224015.1 LysR family transcriptional regulator [Verminephrobacter eiseniae]MCW8233592.1 LysR family transcriptional regulator [Verminephrobacter eiseniae]